MSHIDQVRYFEANYMCRDFKNDRYLLCRNVEYCPPYIKQLDCASCVLDTTYPKELPNTREATVSYLKRLIVLGDT